MPLFGEKEFKIVIKEDGWNLPSLEDFSLLGEKFPYNWPSVKNCYVECYMAKKKIVFPVADYLSDFIFSKIPSLKIKTGNIILSSVRVYYYKSTRFCFELESESKEGWIILIHFLDMDLDGRYETAYYFIEDPIKYFLKFSPKVDENDRFKGMLAVEKLVDK